MQQVSDFHVTLLQELNVRARWYGSGLWQVPFAYVAVTAVAVGGLAHPEAWWVSLAFFGSSFAGALVVQHMNDLITGERRTVKRLQELEEKIFGVRYSEYRGGTSVLKTLVGALTIAYFVAGLAAMAAGAMG